MKHIRRIFESHEDDKRYIEDCFLDISENPDFEVDDLLEVDVPKSLAHPMVIYKLHIELGKNISLPQPIDVYGDVNESVESTEQDLKDILLELKDMGYRIIYEDDVKLRGSPGEPGNVKAIIVRDVMRPSDWIELPWSELKEYALRIKDYLGDKYLSFMWRKVISDNPGTLGDNPYKTIELNEETEINDRVWSFVIKYKE